MAAFVKAALLAALLGAVACEDTFEEWRKEVTAENCLSFVCVNTHQLLPYASG